MITRENLPRIIDIGLQGICDDISSVRKNAIALLSTCMVVYYQNIDQAAKQGIVSAMMDCLDSETLTDVHSAIDCAMLLIRKDELPYKAALIAKIISLVQSKESSVVDRAVNFFEQSFLHRNKSQSNHWV